MAVTRRIVASPAKNSLEPKALPPLPSTLGFDPIKFPSFRQGQYETASVIASSTKPMFLLEAPTGVGKSLLSATTVELKRKEEDNPSHRGLHLVATKQLQDQLQNDLHYPVLKGKSNYPCSLYLKAFPTINADLCEMIAPGGKCPLDQDEGGAGGTPRRHSKHQCAYKHAKAEALRAPMAILNYSLFLTEANFIGGFSGLDYLIADELDVVEDSVANFVEVNFSSQMNKALGLGVPKFKTKPEAWREWLIQAETLIHSAIISIGYSKGDMDKARRVLRLRRLEKKVKFLLEGDLSLNWVLEYDLNTNPPGLSFQPVKVAGFMPDSLWRHTKQTLGMSATILGANAMATELGISPLDKDYIGLPSPFPTEIREVHYKPVANVTRETKGTAYPTIAKEWDRASHEYQGMNILAHTVNYELTRFLVDNARPQHHRVMYHNTANRSQVLQEFRKSKEPAILFSPSMERGVDGVSMEGGDNCSVIIFCKMPALSLASPKVNKRVYGFADGSLWYARKTARNLIQGGGRGTRSLKDWSRTEIWDTQFEGLLSRNRRLFLNPNGTPGWWLSAVRGI